MNRQTVYVAISILGVMLTGGCFAPVHQSEETYPSVSFDHRIGYEREADREAQQHCAQKYGLDAALVHRTPERSIYECRQAIAGHRR